MFLTVMAKLSAEIEKGETELTWNAESYRITSISIWCIRIMLESDIKCAVTEVTKKK